MERTGLEPVTSGLQTHRPAKHHPTSTDPTPMVEWSSWSLPNMD